MDSEEDVYMAAPANTVESDDDSIEEDCDNVSRLNRNQLLAPAEMVILQREECDDDDPTNELSVNSLELFCKQQTELPWTLGKTPTTGAISASEEEVNVETPIKTEYVKSEMDVGDQNEDYLDGITLELEVTNQRSSSDSEDNLPLQNISKKWKADRSNVSEVKKTKISKRDARQIILSKEEPLPQMLERSKSQNFQNSPFKCDLCYKGFVDTEAFEYHQKKHAEILHLPKKRKSDKETEKEILKSRAFLNISDKGEENKTRNEDNGKIPDFKICSKKIKTLIKTIIPNKETTTSNINNDIKNSKIKANSHEQVTAPNNIFICDVCKKEYLCKSFIKKHIKKWHIIGIEQNCKNTNLSIGKDVLKNNNVREKKLSKNKNKHKDSICSDEVQYKCRYCMKCFSQRNHLHRHLRIHTGEKPYKCSYCTKCFSRREHLATHVKIHTGEKPYKCSYCTKCFSQRGHLHRHLRIHTGEKPYKCSYCTKCFSRREHLATHVKIHTGEKPYKCSYCTKCFSRRSNLDRHLRIHTGEQPFKCSFCMKCFTTISELATHERIHKGEKPYKCSSCTKCFTTSSTLATHVRIHTGEKPYKCSYCTKCFSLSNNLAKHVRIHTGEQPFKCSLCVKCFTHSSALSRHVRIHTGEKPYKCSYCTKCFSQRSNLSKHERIHTGDI